jgi:hypothetical protein
VEPQDFLAGQVGAQEGPGAVAGMILAECLWLLCGKGTGERFQEARAVDTGVAQRRCDGEVASGWMEGTEVSDVLGDPQREEREPLHVGVNSVQVTTGSDLQLWPLSLV